MRDLLEIGKEEREAMRRWAREQDEKGAEICMCGGDANNLLGHDGHSIVEPSMAEVHGPCDVTRLLDALEAAEAKLEAMRRAVELFQVGDSTTDATKLLERAMDPETVLGAALDWGRGWRDRAKVAEAEVRRWRTSFAGHVYVPSAEPCPTEPSHTPTDVTPTAR